MADFVRIASYFKMAALDKAGEGARALSGLRDAGVNLLAFSGFPRNRRAQLDFVPADPMAFKAAAKQAKLKVAGPHAPLLGEGGSRPGGGAAPVGRARGAGGKPPPPQARPRRARPC